MTRAAPAGGFRDYSPGEWRADAAVHVVGLLLGGAGCLALLVAAAASRAGPLRLAAFAVYAVGLMAMLGCSALYNMAPEGPRRPLLRRLDHAAIFLMIAGTYTPFAAAVIGGWTGLSLLAFVWAVAVAGIAVEFLGLRAHDGLSVLAYLLMGWSVLPALRPLVAALPATDLALLGAGGVLYSVGVIFHVWERLPYQNVVWHLFVLAGAGCQYAALMGVVARG